MGGEYKFCVHRFLTVGFIVYVMGTVRAECCPEVKTSRDSAFFLSLTFLIIFQTHISSAKQGCTVSHCVRSASLKCNSSYKNINIIS